MSGSALSTEEFINSRGVSRFQLGLGLLGIAILVADGFDIQIISYLMPQITREWGITAGYQGTILSAGFAGTLLGYVVLAPLSPKIGLKRAVVAYLTCAGVLNLATVTAVSPPVLIAFRVATGMALGGLFPSAVALTAEYFPERRRASLVTIMYVGIPMGFLLAGWTAWAVIASLGWRAAMVVAGVIPLLLAVVEMIAGCESLQFLVSRSHHGRQRALAILARIEPRIHSEAVGPQPFASTQSHSASVFGLFKTRRTVGTSALWAALALNSTVYYFILTWLPLILVRIGATQENAILASSLVSFSGIAAGIVTGPLMDLCGRYRIVIVLFGAGAAATVLVGAVLSPVLLVIVPAALCLGFCVSGIQKGVSALAVRFYPTGLRSAGLGWALGSGQIGAIAGPFVAGQLIARGWAPASLFFVMSAPMVAGGIGIWMMGQYYKEEDPTAIRDERVAV
jgi:AAHS family 4-hydroxybenzoate transporter-like MFS transporter